MGTRVASDIIGTARRLLQDESNASQRWSDADLLDGLNEGQIVIVTLMPDANVATEVFDARDGSRHTLPAGGIQFLGLTRNFTTSSGATSGSAITEVTQASIAAADRSYLTTNAEEFDHYWPDADDPKTFWVYPQVNSNFYETHVELRYSKVPDVVNSLGDVITIGDEYAPALSRYIAYAAMSSDLAHPNSQGVAASFFNQFKGALGITGEEG